MLYKLGWYYIRDSSGISLLFDTIPVVVCKRQKKRIFKLCHLLIYFAVIHVMNVKAGSQKHPKQTRKHVKTLRNWQEQNAKV